jgi:hypothetical protein
LSTGHRNHHRGEIVMGFTVGLERFWGRYQDDRETDMLILARRVLDGSAVCRTEEEFVC